MQLPFWIKLIPGYFQEIMKQFTRDLCRVAVCMDDILVSDKNAQEHLENLRALFRRLNEKGLHCNLEKKCIFAQPSVKYLGHTLSKDGIAKGSKVNAVLRTPPPKDVGTLRSSIGKCYYMSFMEEGRKSKSLKKSGIQLGIKPKTSRLLVRR